MLLPSNIYVFILIQISEDMLKFTKMLLLMC